MERLDAAFRPRLRPLGIPRATITVALDEERILIVHPVPDAPDPPSGEDFAFHATNPAVVADHLALLHEAAGLEALRTERTLTPEAPER